MLARRMAAHVPSATIIVIEDKKLGADYGEYRIPGEMLAVAMYNYTLIAPIAQTIFAMRIIGKEVSFLIGVDLI